MEKKREPGKRYPQSLKDKVVAVYIESDASLRELSEKYGVANPTIWRWISNFAKENQEDTRLMDKIRKNSTNYGPRQPIIHQGEDHANPVCKECPTISNLSAEDELQSLRIQLQKERLRADAYEELINVAESKFNIAIRKKAGAKQ